jgi:Flp pilus assembly protein TadG
MKNRRGVLVVEIMVAMVLLLFVVLSLRNISLVSARGQNITNGKDLGNLIARKKLTEVKDSETLPKDGTDTVLQDGVTFTRIWELTRNSPVVSTILVQWNSRKII